MIKIDKENAPSKAPSDTSLFITIFTDGSFCHETKAWGVAVWIRNGTGKAITISKGGVGKKNCVEVELFGLNLAKSYILKNLDIRDKVVIFQSDCIPAMEGFDKSISGTRYVKLKHVKAHNSNGTSRSYVNNLVDKLAKKEMKKYRGKI